MNVLGGGVLGRWWGHEDGALRNGISFLTKKMPESSLTHLARWGPSQKTVIYKEAGPHQTQNLLEPWSWTSLSPEPWEIKVLLFMHSQSMAFCYSRLKGLWQGSYILLAWKSVHSAAWLVLVEVCSSLPDPWTSGLIAVPSLELTGILLRQQVVTTTPFTCTGS